MFTGHDGVLAGSYRNNTTSFFITGTAQDANGVKSVEVSLNNGSSYTTLTGQTTTDGTLLNWNYEASAANVPVEGLKQLMVQQLVMFMSSTGSVTYCYVGHFRIP